MIGEFHRPGVGRVGSISMSRLVDGSLWGEVIGDRIHHHMIRSVERMLIFVILVRGPYVAAGRRGVGRDRRQVGPKQLKRYVQSVYRQNVEALRAQNDAVGRQGVRRDFQCNSPENGVQGVLFHAPLLLLL